ncbi:DoxX family protein [Paenibacillus chitinolyticus]|uniref:DoxX family protein n=2 Tax=Paenibacillus chitinolyticus TaxID=79263 RepID=A0A410WZK1_9BACL|nr:MULTISPECIES: DoxX family protein [Paenibacillus]QAV19889.1 DoxX family protein [Paenibacillus chitinolyticus]
MMNGKTEIGLLIVRLVLGVTFLVHGLDKFQSGLGNIAGWFESIGLPGFLAYVTAVIETVGGAAIILGLGTRIAAALFGVLMIGAMFSVKFSAGFTGNGQSAGFELDLALFALSLLLVLTGSRYLAVDSLFGRSRQTES